SADSDAQLAEIVEQVAVGLDGLSLQQPEPTCGSEDFTYMMRRVQARGGLATCINLGAAPASNRSITSHFGHHTAEFDFDERALPMGVRLLVATVLHLLCDE
ncbi:MAG: hypothetical protein P1S60_17860, partial [Anaerolineae bacterium]|nr:hypothetical protein [Anaerolineae bacterium]